MSASRSWPVALTIAGSDSSGGAGVQADLKTFAALETYGASAVTAVTAQSTRGVIMVHPVPAEVVAAQMTAVLDDLPVAAIKTGMLCRAEIIQVVAEELRRRPGIPLVVDPVMVAASGDPLLEPEAVEVLVEELLPLATVVTPNLPEARRLAGRADLPPHDLIARIADLGAQAVLLKGGHGPAGVVAVDLLLVGGKVTAFQRPWVHTDSTHGTGCTLSAALAAALGKGVPLALAAAEAGDFVHQALARAWPLGGGSGPVHHLHRFWSEP
jgi:hydroxymethylpyrimidine/phosphomethylpyrimidine kinase